MEATAAPRQSQPTIDELVVAADPGRWSDAGFSVEGDCCVVGTIRIRLAGTGAGKGILDWSVRGLDSTELDGLPTRRSERPPARSAAPHRNGVLAIDHVVAFSPDLQRTTERLRAAGLDFRRLREGPTPGGAQRQSFFRLGEALLEVIEAPEGTRMREDPGRRARLWGISFLVQDLEQTGEVLGDRLGTPRDAVQPGRRIATARREAELGLAVSFMTPGPGAA